MSMTITQPIEPFVATDNQKPYFLTTQYDFFLNSLQILKYDWLHDSRKEIIVDHLTQQMKDLKNSKESLPFITLEDEMYLQRQLQSESARIEQLDDFNMVIPFVSLDYHSYLNQSKVIHKEMGRAYKDMMACKKNNEKGVRSEISVYTDTFIRYYPYQFDDTLYQITYDLHDDSLSTNIMHFIDSKKTIQDIQKTHRSPYVRFESDFKNKKIAVYAGVGGVMGLHPRHVCPYNHHALETFVCTIDLNQIQDSALRTFEKCLKLDVQKQHLLEAQIYNRIDIKSSMDSVKCYCESLEKWGIPFEISASLYDFAELDELIHAFHQDELAPFKMTANYIRSYSEPLAIFMTLFALDKTIQLEKSKHKIQKKVKKKNKSVLQSKTIHVEQYEWQTPFRFENTVENEKDEETNERSYIQSLINGKSEREMIRERLEMTIKECTFSSYTPNIYKFLLDVSNIPYERYIENVLKVTKNHEDFIFEKGVYSYIEALEEVNYDFLNLGKDDEDIVVPWTVRLILNIGIEALTKTIEQHFPTLDTTGAFKNYLIELFFSYGYKLHESDYKFNLIMDMSLDYKVEGDVQKAWIDCIKRTDIDVLVSLVSKYMAQFGIRESKETMKEINKLIQEKKENINQLVGTLPKNTSEKSFSISAEDLFS